MTQAFAANIKAALAEYRTREDRVRYYVELLGRAKAVSDDMERDTKRTLCLNDLFFLLVYLLHRADLNRDWLFERCQEVQAEPNECLDLWAREHYKSTIITFGKTIQDILADSEITIAIFSHTRPAAKKPLRQIMQEFERNDDLKALFDDVLWASPKKQAPKWSEDDGLVLKRKGNPKEATLSAWGLIDGMPTGDHYQGRVYDDVIDKKAVNSSEMIKKATDMWELSLSLGAVGGWARYIGTRYHTNDTYAEIARRGSAKLRYHPATENGEVDGTPVFMTRAELAKRRRDQGPYTYAAQMLQNPTADSKQGFRVDWLRYYRNDRGGGGMNKYLLVDPASEKKKSSDYTTMGVIGLAADRNYYLLDLIRDRLNLGERWDALLSLHRRWRPLGVGYEKYGMQCDIEHMQGEMESDNYRFDITPLGGGMAKNDRIRRLVPIMEANRFYVPETLMKTDYEKRVVDLVQAFVEEELKPFPVGLHDDMLDMMARITEEGLNAQWPKGHVAEEDRYSRRRPQRRAISWQAA